MLTARQCELLTAAAQALRDGRAAPDEALLIEHGVTLDEAYNLSDHLALGAEMLLQAATDTTAGGLVRSVGIARVAEALIRSAAPGDAE